MESGNSEIADESRDIFPKRHYIDLMEFGAELRCWIRRSPLKKVMTVGVAGLGVVLPIGGCSMIDDLTEVVARGKKYEPLLGVE